MKKLWTVVSLALGIAFSPICYGGNSSSTQEELMMRALEIAKSRYVGLKTVNVRRQTNQCEVGSAVRVSCMHLISNFHVLTTDSSTFEMNDEKKQELSPVGISTRFDLIVFRSTTPDKNITPVAFASEVVLGEILVNYSNADGVDGFAQFYRVSKITDTYILLDKPAIPGESGSGLFNLKGELVGLFESNKEGPNGDRLYGSAISTKIIRLLIESLEKSKVSCE